MGGGRRWLGLCLLLALAGPGAALQNVTAQLFGAEAYGTLAAFGDFNSDKQTDLFVLRGGNELIIFLADQKEPYFKPRVKLPMKSLGVTITSVVPGDYDGDSQMDVLLTTRAQNHGRDELSVFIFWGHNQTLDLNHKTMLNKTFRDEPLVMDFNGDLIPDVFGVTNDSNLFLTTSPNPQNVQFETWVNKDGNFSKLEETVYAPSGMKVVGQSVFADFDGDGQSEHLLPVCEDKKCQKSAIYLTKIGMKQWIPVLQDFRNKDTLWGFVPYPSDKPSTEMLFPITLHIGDYNMDGYPDALAILQNTSGSNQQAFLLENVPCNNVSCKSVRRMFKVFWELSDLNQIKDAVVATFFDIYEDGILDIIVLSKGYSNKDFAIHTLKNNFEADAYFVKVIVLSGLCSNDCPRKVTPFGVNQPGPYIMYTTVDANGYLKNGSAGQLSQSAHFALQLPYNVLGLGRSANFLDHLYVGIPRPLGEKSIRKQEWTAIIPNSQLIVIPYPHNVPRSWSAKLYLTPSNIVLLTAIALIGVCVFILAIIGILHWQEKKADDREKRQEAHRFHFDAM
ncbi:T-cell immunomodulatory protein isoform X2 [Falco biarmicus]|uniref:T-cell immunomodulatory protein isoform X2 n=1 Tax=Falco cherrug TaxID=345164 RepID=UPI002479DA1C|nr:T-cell immunomodulatory protein isoform X2 [Falco cherrug]XP_055674856.1 T-cell immunomodulatory protein isoform X2 [Falco peregrinus]XP_056216915.1 T-cell immunomodulatory protein isoform X2 [Falco biarmicus]